MPDILHFSLISAIITVAVGCVMWYFSKYDIDCNDIYNQGMHLYKNKHYKSAAEKFEHILSKFPENQNAQYNLGLCFLNLKNYKKAEEAFLAAYNLNKRDFDTVYNIAYTKMLLKDFVQAREYFNELQKSYPNEADVLFNLGHIEVQTQRYYEAISLLEKAISLEPNKLEYQHYYIEFLNLFFDETGEMSILEKLLQLALELEELAPRNEDLTFQIAVAYAKMGDWGNSVTYCEKMIEMNPNSAKACHQYGLSLFCKGENKKAIEMYERAIKLDPKFPDSYVNIVFAYDKVGELSKAQKIIDTFLKNFPDNPNIEMIKTYFERK